MQKIFPLVLSCIFLFSLKANADIINGSFEFGLTGWNVLTPGGSTASVVSSYRNTDSGGDTAIYNAKAGFNFLKLTGQTTGTSPSSVYQTVTLNKGDTISGWAAYDSNDTVHPNWNDGAGVFIFNESDAFVGSPWYALTRQDTTYPVDLYKNINDIGAYNHTEWMQWQWTAETAGDYKVQFSMGDATDSHDKISNAVFDGITLTGKPDETNLPETYGIFIGLREPIAWGNDIDMDKGAQKLKDTMIHSNMLIDDNKHIVEIYGSVLSQSKIEKAINDFGIKDGDTLIFYYGGHGINASEPLPWITASLDESSDKNNDKNDEALMMTTTKNFHESDSPYYDMREDLLYYDDELYAFLNGLGENVEKKIFLDACRSGGFWGDGKEINKNGDKVGDLNLLDNGIMAAASPEEKNAVTGELYDSNGTYYGNYGFFTRALIDAFTTHDGYMYADSDHLRGVSPAELEEYLKNWWTLGAGLGDIIGLIKNGTATSFIVHELDGSGSYEMTIEELMSNWSPMINYTSDFSGAFQPLKPVPEPTTMLLFGTGLAGLAGVARRKKKN